MFIFQIICIILNVVLAIILHCCKDYCNDEFIKLPLKWWILWGVLALIPIASCVVAVIIGILMIVVASEGDMYWGYKLGENHWLNKKY